MKIRMAVATLALGATAVVGTAGVAFASSDPGSSNPVPPSSTDSSRIENRCAKAPSAEAKVNDRLSKLNDRIAKLRSLLASATPGSRKAIAIQHRIDVLQHRVVRLTTLESKLTAWVSAHCPATNS